MSNKKDVIKVFVGSDRSQLIAYKVLEHSIRRNSSHDVEIRSIDNTMMPECNDILNAPYTNFSFARFGIPSFTGYKGKAIYMDADMMVFTDIANLWNIPFGEAKVLLLEQPSEEIKKRQSKPRKQTAVMLLDCAALTDWIPERIIGDLGKKYDRTALMSLHILPEKDICEIIPSEWNCMDWYEEGRTHLLHYTKIETQPWVYPGHSHGDVWMTEVKQMLADGSMTGDFILQEIANGYVRPSLAYELGLKTANTLFTTQDLLKIDNEAGYEMHKEMVQRHEDRMRRLKEHKKLLSNKASAIPSLAKTVGRYIKRLAGHR